MLRNLFNPKPPPTMTVAAPVFAQPTATETAPVCVQAIVATVLDAWETPDAAQYQHGFDNYIRDLLTPIAAMEDDLDAQRLKLRLKIERMIEIAPDLFEKALRQSGLETHYLIPEVRDGN